MKIKKESNNRGRFQKHRNNLSKVVKKYYLPVSINNFYNATPMLDKLKKLLKETNNDQRNKESK